MQQAASPSDELIKMKTKKFRLIIFAITLLFAAPLHSADQDLSRQIKEHKARSESTWTALAAKEFDERILPAPDIILDYLRLENQYQGFSERPQRPEEIDPEFLADINNAYFDLPEVVKDQIKEHILAIFLVQDLGGSAYAELLRDFEKNKLGFIVLDVSVLNRKANAWLSWKENSPFNEKGGYSIQATLETEINNTRKSAIQFILLHEIGHIIGVAKGAHPNWASGGNPEKWPFAKYSWIKKQPDSKAKTRHDKVFPLRSKVQFYSFQKAPLTSSDIEKTYSQLIKTDFVSLYSSTNMYDDFAETYALYVHTVLQDRPYIINILKNDGTTRLLLSDPIQESRCEVKKKYMDKFFE